MTTRTLILRSLRFHARSHLGTLLGAAIGTAVLVGALVVGDSVRGSLREMALQRLAGASVAMHSGDRFFETSLLNRLWVANAKTFENWQAVLVGNGGTPIGKGFVWGVNQRKLGATVALNLPAVASRQDGAARANQINLIGVQSNFFHTTISIEPGTVLLNAALAAQLNAQKGDSLIFRTHKPSALSHDAVITPRDQSIAIRLKVAGIAPETQANFSLLAAQTSTLNAFVALQELGEATDLPNKANLFLFGPAQKIVQDTFFERLRTVLRSPDPEYRNWEIMRQYLSRPIGRHGVYSSSEEEIEMIDPQLRRIWELADAQLQVATISELMIQLSTSRIFLDPPVVQAALSPGSATNSTVTTATNGIGVLTYLVNLLQAGERATPYSMVTATGAPWVPADMADDEIIVNEWLSEDLAVKPGDSLRITYYLADSASTLTERTSSFRVRSVVPMSGLYADRTLMPEFPGIAKAESTHDWDAAFPLIHKFRDKDDAYWKQHRGTPKAFVTLAAGQKMWANRFGNLTAIRWLVPTGTAPEAFRSSLERNLRANLDPASVGLKFEPVRDRALKAVAESQDFGGLFIGFSFFLIAAALALMWLLFQFSIEQRSTEVGTLLALGFTPRQVRRLLLAEGIALAAIGGVIGVFAGTWYARAMVHGLSTIWRDAVGTSSLQYFAQPVTLVLGAFAGIGVAAVTIWFALRKQARQPARVLLSEGGEERESKIEDRRSREGWSVNRSAEHCSAGQLQSASSRAMLGAPSSGRWSWLVGIGSAFAAIGMVAFALGTDQTTNAGLFFGAGALLLTAGLSFSGALLRKLALRSTVIPTLNDLGLRNATRRRKRSLAVIGSLACGSFLIASIGVFRLDSNADATKRSSGTGGFAYFAQSSQPIIEDLNTQKGRDEYALDTNTLAGVAFVPFRVRDGDDASCLNLNRAQQPRLLGVNPSQLAGRFAFAKVPRSSRGDETHSNAERGVRSAEEGSQSLLTSPATKAENDPWLLLDQPQSDGAIPAIGDANSIQWALGKKLGDTISYTDESGQEFKVRLVAGVANSILQGNLIISETEFKTRFPREAGYRTFLIDAAPANESADGRARSPLRAVNESEAGLPDVRRARSDTPYQSEQDQVAAALTRALQDKGFEMTRTTVRLAAFNAVQNTYLGTFQILGGLGLLLGSAGLGVVVLRNVLERRGELAVLLAVGFRRQAVRWLVVSEHGALLVAGLGIGVVSALVAVLPALLAPGGEFPYQSLALTLGAVLVSGGLWTWVAASFALRGQLLNALRNE